MDDAQRHVQRWVKVCAAMCLFVILVPLYEFKDSVTDYRWVFFWEQTKSINDLSARVLVPILMLVLLLFARRFRHPGVCIALLVSVVVAQTVSWFFQWRQSESTPDIWWISSTILNLLTLFFISAIPAMAHRMRLGLSGRPRAWMLFGVLGTLACAALSQYVSLAPYWGDIEFDTFSVSWLIFPSSFSPISPLPWSWPASRRHVRPGSC